jgi:hypothetical protein
MEFITLSSFKKTSLFERDTENVETDFMEAKPFLMNERRNELFHSSKKKHTHRLTPKYPLGPETTKRTLVIEKKQK